MLRMINFLMLVVAAALLQPQGVMAAEGSPVVADSDVRVGRSGASFSVDLVMHAPVPPPQAWAVLTDFEHMADFIPNLKSSQVVERKEMALQVSQKGVARYGIFSADFESLREIRLTPQHEIRAHGLGGNVRRMESVMQLEAETGGTRLQYHAEVQPDFWFPPLIGPALVQRQTAEQFSAMIQEMLRRR